LKYTKSFGKINSNLKSKRLVKQLQTTAKPLSNSFNSLLVTDEPNKNRYQIFEEKKRDFCKLVIKLKLFLKVTGYPEINFFVGYATLIQE